MNHALTPSQIWIARGIALAADGLQIALFPLFGEGFVSPANVVLDLVVAFVLTRLIGWHIAFVPSFVVEMMPVADLAPTWTLAVLVATRGRTAEPSAAGEPIRVDVSRRA